MKLVMILIISFFMVISPANSRQISEVELMALNIYHEARGEPLHGKIAVMHVVINRLNDPRFPKTIHDVILERRNNTCQFTWVCRNSLRLPVNDPEWEYFIRLANTFMRNHYYYNDNTNGSLYFRRINTRQNYNVIINNHIFYR